MLAEDEGFEPRPPQAAQTCFDRSVSIKVFASILISSSLAAGCVEPRFQSPTCDGFPSDIVVEPREPMSSEQPSEQRVAEVLPTEHRAVDLLFVIDNSRSMLDEQEQLGIWSSELFNVLSFEGELPDLHVAVTTSSITVPADDLCAAPALNGRFHTGEVPLGEVSFLRDIATTEGRERNYDGAITEAFARMANVGENGCGFEQPFEATRRALSGSIAENEGFLREDALLVVVIVSDEDDCSTWNDGLYGDRYQNSCSALGKFSDYRCFEFGVECADGKRSREVGVRNN